jgi:cell division protein ZapA
VRVVPKNQEGQLKVGVKIYGEEYVVKGSATREYIENIALQVDQRMVQLARRNPNLSLSRIAVLTALNLADELNRLQEDYDILIKLLEDDKP